MGVSRVLCDDAYCNCCLRLPRQNPALADVPLLVLDDAVAVNKLSIVRPSMGREEQVNVLAVSPRPDLDDVESAGAKQRRQSHRIHAPEMKRGHVRDVDHRDRGEDVATRLQMSLEVEQADERVVQVLERLAEDNEVVVLLGKIQLVKIVGLGPEVVFAQVNLLCIQI